jgi:hypothetical protein
LIVRLTTAAIALFLLLEVSARLVIFGPAGLDPRRVGILRETHPIELVTYETEPDLVYEYRPNLDVFFKLVRFRTNSRGMRDEEYALAKPPNTFRVAVLGSSFALPAGVEIEDAFHSLLEERFDREFAPTRYEFLNFAVGMYGPSQFLAMLRHRALAFDPDLVLLSVSPLAAPRLLSEWNYVPPREVLDLVPSGPRSYFAKLLESRLKLGPPTFRIEPQTSPSGVPERQDVIAKLGETSRETGIPFVVVRVEYDARDPSAVEREIEQRVRDEGMLYVDTRAAFQGTNPRDFWIYELDPHPNRKAHAIFADVVAEFLRTHHLLGR